MTTDPPPTALPPGATPIGTDELLAIIGEQYVQIWHLRRTLAQLASAAAAPNGTIRDAVHHQQ